MLKRKVFHLVILVTRLEASRGLIRDGPRNVLTVVRRRGRHQRRKPPPSFSATPAGGLLTPYALFRVKRALIHSGSSVESGLEPEPPAPKPRSNHYVTVALKMTRKI
ncbi:hypothetical protein AVEN_130417-1 [Araneus ventricosus]|uniref:Secreted protein n=1 Tax=Araneus ventricosus TaxID=182803 RepID=A0A4Y2BDI6_ARAVE|nr:hypothetical protein AVEN_130417-1 [Araneus ventricosus]